MTPGKDNGRDLDGEDALAAEYVLGVLPAEQRRALARRIETEPEFARLVDRWEVLLSPMAAEFTEVAAPPSVKEKLDRTLGIIGPKDATRSLIWGNLAFWRGLAAVATAALVLLASFVAVPFLRKSPEPAGQFVASLVPDKSDVRFLAVYNGVDGQVGLSRISGEPASGRDFELWVIESGNSPVSVGVIPGGPTARLILPERLRGKLDHGAVFAISLEPKGGSPTGQPTGPVVAAGELRKI